MIRPEILVQQFRKRPFQPVRLIAAEGLRYDIYHPDGVIVMERDLIIAMSPNNHGVYHQSVRVSLAHLVAVEDLLPPAPVNGSEGGAAEEA